MTCWLIKFGEWRKKEGVQASEISGWNETERGSLVEVRGIDLERKMLNTVL